MVKNSFIHEVLTRKTLAFNPGHRCQIVVNENKIFPEKFTSHTCICLQSSYSLANLASEVVACENIETSKLSKFKTKFRQNEKVEMEDLHHLYHCAKI